MAIFFFAQVDLVFARQKPSDQGMFWYSAFPCSQIFCFNFLFTLIFAPITILAFINWRKLIKLEEAMGTIIVMTFLSTIFCWSYDFVLFLIPIFEILSFSVLRSGLRGSKIGKMFLIFLFISSLISPASIGYI